MSSLAEARAGVEMRGLAQFFVELFLALGQRARHHDLEHGVEIARAAAGLRQVAAEAAAPAGGAAEDAHLLEEVREIDVAHVLRAPRAEAVEPVRRRPEVLPRAVASQAVVGAALFLVAQRLVGLRHLLEL